MTAKTANTAPTLPPAPVALFEHGTPDEPGAALAAFARVRRDAAVADAAGPPLRWHVDPGNLGLLSRAVRELAPRRIEAVLRADDIADDQTVVAHECELVPTLRRLAAEHGLPLVMSNGRPYHLPPPALDISTNDLCGLSCNMCGNRQTERDPHTMSPAQVRALIAEAAAWGIRRVALTGAGEPFRDRHMLDHIRYANEHGHLVTITSNGFPISEAIAGELAGRVVSVSISIHGATEATHDHITGVSKAGDNAWRAIRRLVRARDARPGGKLSVNVSTVIQRANLAEIPALVRRACAEGVDGINLQPVNLQHGAFRDGQIIRRDDVALMARLWPAPDQRAALDAMFDELEALQALVGKRMHASPERLALMRRYFRDSSRAALAVACRVGEAFLAVDHRGEIKPCYRLPWSHGDARSRSVRALWNSRAYQRTRAHVDA
ncbi:MAG TPA: radical SAM/SPASM domain-containing protein, partial [Kofleriaceae bacterium]|nr:radical SAM/SPASM domain-containing protein [Kofleriaceae bacterium]